MCKKTRFAKFCMESYKVHRTLTGKQVFQLFEQYGVFDYIREFYDVLHTTGYAYINDDIDRYLSVRQAVIR